MCYGPAAALVVDHWKLRSTGQGGSLNDSGEACCRHILVFGVSWQHADGWVTVCRSWSEDVNERRTINTFTFSFVWGLSCNSVSYLIATCAFYWMPGQGGVLLFLPSVALHDLYSANLSAGMPLRSSRRRLSARVSPWSPMSHRQPEVKSHQVSFPVWLLICLLQCCPTSWIRDENTKMSRQPSQK